MKEYILNPLFAIFLLTVIAAFFVWINSAKDSKIRDQIYSGVDTLKIKSAETIERLKDANRDISKSLEKTIKANEQLAENNLKLAETYLKTIEAKEAIIDAQKDIIGQITGGDSYPRIFFGKKGFFVTANGQYSIPELRVDIYFLKNYLNIPSEVNQAYLKDQTESEYIYKISGFTIPKLWINGNSSLIPIKKEIRELLIHNSSSVFDIIFTSGYKRWIQNIRFVQHDNNENKWGVIDILDSEKPIASTIDNIESSRIYLEVSNDFPLSIFDSKTNEKHYDITLYNLDNQHLSMYQPNFVAKSSLNIEKQPTYGKTDFLE